MTIYPDEQKTSLSERMLPPRNERVPQLSKETGIPKETLYGGRRQALTARGLSSHPPSIPQKGRASAGRRGEVGQGGGDGGPE